jgi:dipeptidyl aminopeptidase
MTHSTLLVNASLVLDHERRPLVWQTWRLSPDGKYVLFRADSKQQWRHSSRANYWVYRLSDSTSFPITTLEYPPRTAFASWSPVGHALAFVHSNDLYVIPESAMGDSNPKAVRVTTDGSETVFNGVPDWVYEEEVYSTDSVLWWSPDGRTLAYLRSDETEVKDYRLQFYNPSGDAFDVHQYTTELDMKSASRFRTRGTNCPGMTLCRLKTASSPKLLGLTPMRYW